MATPDEDATGSVWFDRTVLHLSGYIFGAGLGGLALGIFLEFHPPSVVARSRSRKT